MGQPQRPSRDYDTGPVTSLLRVLAIVLALGISVYVGVRYPGLPDQVPTHFGFGGEPDDYGPRWTVLLLGGIMLLLVVGLSWLSSKPHTFNYPVQVTERNAQAVYREGERMMAWTALALVVLYAGVVLAITETGGGAVLIIVGIAAIVLALVVGLIRTAVARRAS